MRHPNQQAYDGPQTHDDQHAYDDQQAYDDNPETVKSDPVPVPAAPGDDDTVRTDTDAHTDIDTHTEVDTRSDTDNPDADHPDEDHPDEDHPDEVDAAADGGVHAEDGVRAEEAHAEHDTLVTRDTDTDTDTEHDSHDVDGVQDTEHDTLVVPDADGDGVRDDDQTPPQDQDPQESETGTVAEHPVAADERVEFNEPAPVPTAFGATTVGGAVAASALASHDRSAEPDPRDEDTVGPGDGVVDDEARDRTAFGEPTGGELNGSPVDPYSATGPTETLPATAVPTDEAAGVDTVSDPAPDVLAEEHPDAVDTEHAVLVAGATAADGELLPGEVPTEASTTLLAAEAAQGFRDRWRDVQLRFVDDPRAAAGEAQGLAEEAIEALAAALAAQKDDLGGWQDGSSGDTEQLRVVVRRYRDFLDKMLAL